MNLTFFIKSTTVDISNYKIKDIPGSSGRLDVIARCILSAMLNGYNLEKNIQIWIFLDKYGTYIFNSNLFEDELFPKTEIRFVDYFVEFIKSKQKSQEFFENPLKSVEHSKLGIFDAIKKFDNKKYKIYVLDEKGIDFNKEFKKIKSKDNLLCILGDQSGDLITNCNLRDLNLVNLSLGNRSYLASSAIRLIKTNLQLLL